MISFYCKTVHKGRPHSGGGSLSSSDIFRTKEVLQM